MNKKIILSLLFFINIIHTTITVKKILGLGFGSFFYQYLHSEKAKKNTIIHEDGHYKFMNLHKNYFYDVKTPEIKRKLFGIFGETNFKIKEPHNDEIFFKAKLAGGINQLIHNGYNKEEIINILTKEGPQMFMIRNYNFGDEIESLKFQKKYNIFFEENTYKKIISDVYNTMKNL